MTMQGAAMVIHVGAAMKGGPIEHRCATVMGTQNVLEACHRHGVQLVYQGPRQGALA